MKIEIVTWVWAHRYIVSVKRDGMLISSIPCTPGQVIRVRNQLCERWSEEAVFAGPIPEIPTVSYGGHHCRRTMETDAN